MHEHGPSDRDTLIAEVGSDPSVLIVVFSGARGRWGSRRHDFSETTQALHYSRILCRDPRSIWYHEGIDATCADIRALVAYISEHIEALAPSAKLFIGNSVGGYAAILFGHLLQADSVHAFAPQTCLQPDYVRRYRRLDTAEKADAYERLWRSRRAERKWFDLNAVLEGHNGRTSYFVHYCEGSEPDRQAAAWIAGRAGVRLCTYACEGHSVVRHIAKERLLLKILRPDLKEVVAALARAGKLQ